jgi:hypothetical protein
VNAVDEALKIFALEAIPEMGQLKATYRKLATKMHPDAGGTNNGFLVLQDAYDCLVQYATAGTNWQKEQLEHIEEWRKLFRDGWKETYQKTRMDTSAAKGLHFNTYLESFRRAYVYPPSDWFTYALFGKPKQQITAVDSKTGIKATEFKQTYRQHLLRIAPNPRMAESYAKKYWELEFCEKWVFYLPACIEQLRAS